MTPEQYAEVYVEDKCDNIAQFLTDIELVIKNAYKAGYDCAVAKTEEWLRDDLFVSDDIILQYNYTITKRL